MATQKRALGYIRTSKEKREAISPNQQNASIAGYCKSQGWEFVGSVRDLGKSGKDLERPGIKKILKDIKEKKNNFDILVTWKLDRLSRKQRDICFLLEDIFNPEKTGVGYDSATEPINTTTGMGRAFCQILGTFAELEWGNSSERNKAIANYLKKKKRILGAKYLVPFGFKKVNSGKYLKDLKPDKNHSTLKKILDRRTPVRNLIKTLQKPRSTIYFIRANPIYSQIMRK